MLYIKTINFIHIPTIKKLILNSTKNIKWLLNENQIKEVINYSIFETQESILKKISNIKY
jgi:hypothetical protein